MPFPKVYRIKRGLTSFDFVIAIVYGVHLHCTSSSIFIITSNTKFCSLHYRFFLNFNWFFHFFSSPKHVRKLLSQSSPKTGVLTQHSSPASQQLMACFNHPIERPGQPLQTNRFYHARTLLGRPNTAAKE